jgi:hypothetical protein
MQSLAHLSDDELVAELTACCSDTRRNKVHTLMFLAEVEAREIYLRAAASSMWDYARRLLRMSHGAAHRNVCVARLCRKYPFLLERIENGESHISTLAYIASFITDDNVQDIVEKTSGMNRRHVDLVLSRWFGVKPKRPAGSLPYDDELLALLARVRELTSHAIPSGDPLLVLKAALSVCIMTLEKTKRAKTDNPRPAPTEPTKEISRHATRTMFEEHGEQCCYVDERTGARCPSRVFIEREHADMRCHGGTHDPSNLRPMCRAHNLWLAKQKLGCTYVEERIHFRQRKGNDSLPE